MLPATIASTSAAGIPLAANSARAAAMPRSVGETSRSTVL
jgi:hypothetical protein